MKKFLPYLLISLYLTIMLKPVMPYITDAVAHILNFKGHMATEHAHHGRYHVHTEVAESAKNETSETNPNALKKQGPESDQIVTSKFIVLYFPDVNFKYFSILNKNAKSGYLNNHFPPPKS